MGIETLEQPMTEVAMERSAVTGDPQTAALEEQFALPSAPEPEISSISEEAAHAGIADGQITEVADSGAFNKIGNFLVGTRLGRAATAGTVALSLATAYTLVRPDVAEADKECTRTVEGTTCVITPPGSKPPDGGSGGNNGGDHGNNKPPKQGGSRGSEGPLRVPEKRTRKHWATKILNEVLQGRQGRISASPEAKEDLFQARAGNCSPIEMKPGQCVKLDKTLLKVLYKTSKEKRFYIWHFTSGPHVATSHHWDGNATDLRKFNGKAPWNKSLLKVLLRNTPANKNTERIGPHDDEYHTGADDGHWHFAVF
ncbi:MAG TPA: hypothetical protein VFX86_04510 [Candidatus Saccharimonadales bacterium]|nr:hypothetical protein [Candidatus Saccharimonadales bacterium]